MKKINIVAKSHLMLDKGGDESEVKEPGAEEGAGPSKKNGAAAGPSKNNEVGAGRSKKKRKRKFGKKKKQSCIPHPATLAK